MCKHQRLDIEAGCRRLKVRLHCETHDEVALAVGQLDKGVARLHSARAHLVAGHHLLVIEASKVAA